LAEKSIIIRWMPNIAERVPLRPDQPEHPYHALFCQIRAHIHAQYAQHGRAPDETSGRVTMSLYARAREVGITRADHVVFSQPNEEKGVKQNEYIFVVQGKMDDPGMVRAMLPLQQAANTPVAESLERVRQIEQRQQQEALAQQQTQQKDSPMQDDPSQGGPKLVR
jgi:hypothetical protein